MPNATFPADFTTEAGRAGRAVGMKKPSELWARWGFRAALANTALLAGYAVATVATFWAGPVSAWWGNDLTATPGSLYLAFGFALASLPLYLVMMAGVHASAPEGRRIATLIALAITTVFVAMLALVYSVQIAAVRPGILHGQADRVAALAYQSVPSAMFAADIYGYGFLGLAMLFAAPAFSGRGLERALRWSFIGSGLADLVGVAAFSFDLPGLLNAYLVAMSVGLFASTILLAVFFRRKMRTGSA